MIIFIEKQMFEKIKFILTNSVPIILMIGLIPFIKNDYLLTIFYILIVIISFLIKKDEWDLLIFGFGAVIMIVAESFFINTKVEVFLRNSLFGIMPLWLPILWGYSFVVIKRSVNIICSKI